MKEDLAKSKIYFLDILHCPHHIDGVVKRYTMDCDCRKPRPGMFLRAAKKHKLDMKTSGMFGDKEIDMEAAHAAGVLYRFLVGDKISSQFATEIFPNIEDAVDNFLSLPHTKGNV